MQLLLSKIRKRKGENMNNQFQTYTLDDKAFYTKDEVALNKELICLKTEKKLIEEFTIFNIVNEKEAKFCFKDLKEYRSKKYDKEKGKRLRKDINKFLKYYNFIRKNPIYLKSLKNNEMYKEIRAFISIVNKELNEIINTNNNLTRRLNSKILKPWNRINLFESDLSRTLDFKKDELTIDLFIIRVYRHEIMKQLINNGFELYITKKRSKNKKINLVKTKLLKFPKEIKFNYLKERYVTLTSSAGQIRTKKVVFIKKETKDNFTKTFMCGLSIERINELGGMNINKFLSYLALINSATDEIKGFDINRSIVINDFETIINDEEVDFIDKKLVPITRKVKNKETGEKEEIKEEYWELADKPVRKPMDIKITHSDGCGWVLPSISKKNFMLRLPWIKGLLSPCDFISYCNIHNDGNYKITDIYGKEWDLKEDNIQYVFSRSQFKLWDKYDDWDDYKKKFIENNCHANYCNEESDKFEKKRYNYQMLQTLTDISPEEIDEIIKPTIESIKKSYTDRSTMLQLLGATTLNNKKTYLQEALRIYPELINDKHVKEDLSDIINSKIKEAKCGKIQLDCTYTYLIPDIFAWLQFSISGEKEPKGLLEKNQVFCKLYKDEKELLIERSPHLAKEHGVREHAYSKDKEDWFCTDGIYTSCHDLISKLLQFDNDGDRALVVAGQKIIDIARRNMEGVVPLYYVMGKADPQTINDNNIYESLKLAFRYGNIGMYSNKLTKLWNMEEEKEENKKVERDNLIRILVALNNYSIDAAKTLEMPRASEEMTKKINAIDKLDLPYFFQFAKKKENKKVAPMNDSTVNQICKKIEEIKIPVKEGTKNEKYDFGGIGNFKSSTLMNNPKIKIEETIEADGKTITKEEAVIAKYEELNKSKNKFFMWLQYLGLKKEEGSASIYQTIEYDFKNYCKKLGVKIVDAVDIVIKHVYKYHPQSKKSFMFNCFGLMIINNLKKNIKKSLEKGYFKCSCCGKRIKKQSNSQKMCEICRESKRQERDRKRKANKKKSLVAK